jgi:hypothetical protein
MVRGAWEAWRLGVLPANISPIRAGQFSSFDREVQTTRSPIEQANPECRFQLFNLPAQGGLRDVERFGRLPKTSGPGDFREGH